jgi:hypothetical protein
MTMIAIEQMKSIKEYIPVFELMNKIENDVINRINKDLA